MGIAEIKNVLLNSYDYVLCHKDALQEQLPFEIFLKEDDSGEYYSINEISSMMPTTLQPVIYFKPDFRLVRWSFVRDEGKEEQGFIASLESLGYVNMKPTSVDEIDWANVPDNAVGIFSAYELLQVPKALS